MSIGFQLLKQLIQKVRQDDCFGLAAEMAFNLMLSFVPAMVFLVSLLGLIGKETEIMTGFLGFITQFAPEETVILLSQTFSAIVRGSSSQLTLLGLLGAFWAASNGAVVLIKAIYRAYHFAVGGRSYWFLRGIAMLVVLSLGVALFVASNMVVLGHVLIDFAEDFLNITVTQARWINLMRWTVAIVSITGFSAAIYALVPWQRNHRVNWKAALGGAVVFVALWLGSSWAFSMYISQIVHLNPVYGVMGALIILMTWVYFSSLAMVIGGEVSSVLAHARQSGECHKSA